VIYGSYARRAWAPDHPFGRTEDEMNRMLERMEHEWGGVVAIDTWAPSADESFKQWECEVLGDKLAGIAVSRGARVAATADAGEVRVSNTVKDLVAGSGIGFESRSVHALKGVPRAWPLFAVTAA